MGVGYEASPLHRISYLPVPPGPEVCAEPAELADPILRLLTQTGCVDLRPIGPFVSPAVEQIVAWRAAIASKYQGQLDGEALVWDEGSDFQQSEDTGTSEDLMLRYVAAVLDQQGEGQARAVLLHASKPSYPVMDKLFAEANRLGFAGRFPQLLLGARYWLPFHRHLIIEEPSWTGHIERFGSLFHLQDELAQLRGAMARIDPSATRWTAQRTDRPVDVLSAAWQASDTIQRLCDVAVSRHLPLWTTG